MFRVTVNHFEGWWGKSTSFRRDVASEERANQAAGTITKYGYYNNFGNGLYIPLAHILGVLVEKL